MYNGLKRFYKKGKKEDFFISIIFRSYSEEKYFGYSESAISRWFNGEANVSYEIVEYYSKNKEKLYADIKNRYFNAAVDFYTAGKEILDVLTSDMSISENRKNELINFYKTDFENLSVFIAEVLLFSMNRETAPQKNKSMLTDDVLYGCNINRPCKFFVGREKEISELHQTIQKENCVFVEGIGGIGKSELIRKYVQTYKGDYTNIIYLRYSGSLKNMIADIQFLNDTQDENFDDRFRRHYKFLKTLKDDTLIIIDNFDTTITDDDFFDDFISNEYKTLFTSRGRFENNTAMELSEMEDDDLLKLVNGFYAITEKNKGTLTEIIKTVHSHTLSVELAARLLGNGYINPDELLVKLIENNINPDSSEKVIIKKDNKTRKSTFYEHLHLLFALFNLSDKQKYIMGNFCFVSVNGIEMKRFALWIGENNSNDIIELAEMGLIINDSGRLYINAVIRDVVKEELKPAVTQCKALITCISAECIMFGDDKYYYHDLLDFADNIISDIAVDDIDIFMFMIGEVFAYADKYNELPVMKRILNTMEYYIKNELTAEVKHKALYYLYKSRYAILKYPNAYDNAAAFAEKGIALIEKNTTDDLKHLLSNLYSALGDYKAAAVPKDLNDIKKCYGLAYSLLEEIGELYSYDGYMIARKTAHYLVKTGNIDKGISLLENVAQIFKPDTIPENYNEYVKMRENNKFSTLLEYTEILTDLILYKAKNKQKPYAEYNIVAKIYNTIYENEPEKIPLKEIRKAIK